MATTYRAKKKDELNYRRGGTARHCGCCDHYVPDFQVFRIGGEPHKKAPRCKIIGLENSIRYQVNYNAICDSWDNTERMKKLRNW